MTYIKHTKKRYEIPSTMAMNFTSIIANIRTSYYTYCHNYYLNSWRNNMFGNSNFCKFVAAETAMLIAALSAVFALGIAIF